VTSGNKVQDAELRTAALQLYRERGNVEAVTRGLRAQGIVVSQRTVRSILVAAGVTFEGHYSATVKDFEALAERYQQGTPVAVLAREAGVADGTLARRLEEAGLKEPPPSRA
jgi:hypothetical protein